MENYKRLLQYHDEIESMKGSFLAICNRSKISDFYKNNGIKLNTLGDKIKALRAKHFIMVEGKDDEITITTVPAVAAVYKEEIVPKVGMFGKETTKQVLVTPEIPAKQEPVMQPGKTREMFEEAYRELMQTEIEIKY